MDFEECFPLCQLKSNDIEGRYIVAAKDIKQGETIMEELPAVRCPPYSTKPARNVIGQCVLRIVVPRKIIY